MLSELNPNLREQQKKINHSEFLHLPHWIFNCQLSVNWISTHVLVVHFEQAA
jgi:hypothetical protein